ncbi:MAG: hypothetical protein ACRELB_12830, partial [Polyangiaceae bacterium]
AWDPAAGSFSLSYAPSASSPTQVTEIQLPSRAFPAGYAVDVSNGCYDATSAPGRLLVQADPGATSVSVSITPQR